MIYVDLIDTVDYLSHSASLTGIQRVQLELARHLSAQKPVSCAFVIGTRGDRLMVADPDALWHLLDVLDNRKPDLAALAASLARLDETSLARSLTAADAFVATGMFWNSPATMVVMLRTKLHGGRVGFLCHDLIPITHRQYCPEQLTALFTQGLEVILELADFAVTNSQHVQGELTKHLSRSGLDIPTAAVPLARDFAAGDETGQPSADVAALAGRRFVLFLATI